MRPKRQLVAAAVGGVAVGGMAIYSWLTETEANDHAGAINNLKTNQDRLMELLRNQTSVLELTGEVIQRSLQQIESEHQTLIHSINNVARVEEKTDLGWQIHDVALQYALLLENYADIQDRIIDATMTVHNGHLHPVLVSVMKLHRLT